MSSEQDETSSSEPLASFLAESSDYYAGFTSVIREVSDAQARGFDPTERQLVLAVTHSTRIYTSARSGKPISGRSPDWLRGRVAGLRSVLRRKMDARQQTE